MIFGLMLTDLQDFSVKSTWPTCPVQTIRQSEPVQGPSQGAYIRCLYKRHIWRPAPAAVWEGVALTYAQACPQKVGTSLAWPQLPASAGRPLPPVPGRREAKSGGNPAIVRFFGTCAVADEAGDLHQGAGQVAQTPGARRPEFAPASAHLGAALTLPGKLRAYRRIGRGRHFASQPVQMARAGQRQNLPRQPGQAKIH